jgi:hypothetical protein
VALYTKSVRRHPCGNSLSHDSSSNDPFVRNHTERLFTVSEQALRDIAGRNRVNVDFSVLFGFYQNSALAQKPINMQHYMYEYGRTSHSTTVLSTTVTSHALLEA